MFSYFRKKVAMRGTCSFYKCLSITTKVKGMRYLFFNSVRGRVEEYFVEYRLEYISRIFLDIFLFEVLEWDAKKLRQSILSFTGFKILIGSIEMLFYFFDFLFIFFIFFYYENCISNNKNLQKIGMVIRVDFYYLRYNSRNFFYKKIITLT